MKNLMRVLKALGLVALAVLGIGFTILCLAALLIRTIVVDAPFWLAKQAWHIYTGPKSLRE